MVYMICMEYIDVLAELSEYIKTEFRKRLQEIQGMEKKQNEHALCQAKTKSNKQCTNKATCCNNTVCKLHKNYIILCREVKQQDIVYHNHLPNLFRDDCPRCAIAH